jgi:hypothetical protein
MDVGVVAEARKLAKRGTLTRQSLSNGLLPNFWFTFLSVSGSGHMLSFAAHCLGWSSSGNLPLRITVDGGTPYMINVGDYLPKAYEGGGSVASTLLLTPIRFNTSLVIEAQHQGSGGQTIDATGYLVL